MQKITISLDAMGGEGAPEVVISAVAESLKAHRDIFFLIYGNEDQIIPLLKKYCLPETRYEFIATTYIIEDDAKPLQAFKCGANSSMRKAIEAVKEEKADACVSCGNTGALLVTAKMVLGALSGVKRPAIAGIFPTLHGSLILLDMGANNECSELVLFQFALMGRCLAKALLNIENPRIAILNVGKEETKGRELEQKSYEILKHSGLNFVGYIEGHDIVNGRADVVVTDGFSGNLVLKASEGALKMVFKILNDITKKSGFFALIGAKLLEKPLRKHFKKLHPDVNNGAMFIGLDGIVVKSHGSCNAVGLQNAIKIAYELAKRRINVQILKEVRILEEKGIGLNFVDKVRQTSAKIFGIRS